jgi:cytochrome c553
MNTSSKRRWQGVALGGLFSAVMAGVVLSAQGSAQTAPPPAAPAAAMPNLDPSKVPPGDAANGEKLSANCVGCHGPLGVSETAKFPRLAGQKPSYMTLQLLILRAGLRPSQIMNRVAAKLSDQDIADLVAHFSAQKVGEAWTGQDPARVAEGAKLFALGSPERGVIACQVCHGMQGNGVNELEVALIRHQSPEYAVSVMHEFQKLGTMGSPQSTAMYLEMKPLSDPELEAIAAYLASMP